MNKSSGYNYESSRGSYGRGYAPAEPEWYTEGPISQSDTIELHGFDGENSRTRHTSGSDASHDDGRLDGDMSKADHRNVDDRGGGKSGSVKNKDTSSGRSRDVIQASDTVSNAVLDEEHHQQNSRGMCHRVFESYIFSCKLHI